MKIVEIKKNPTWTEVISELAIGDSFAANFANDANTIRPLLSSRIALKFPLRQYTTSRTTIKKTEYLVVTRIEDKVTDPISA